MQRKLCRDKGIEVSLIPWTQALIYQTALIYLGVIIASQNRDEAEIQNLTIPWIDVIETCEQ